MTLTMPPAVRVHYREERRRAEAARRDGDRPQAWHHLERAHILAQPWSGAHTGSHLAMLRLAVRDGDFGEVIGQAVRALLAGPASLLGRAPSGNNGRKATPLNATAALPNDLATILARHDTP